MNANAGEGREAAPGSSGSKAAKPRPFSAGAVRENKSPTKK